MFDMDGLMFDTERIGRDGWHKAAEILHIDLPEGIIAAMRGTGTAAKFSTRRYRAVCMTLPTTCGCAMRTRSSLQTACR